jgi:hypothetical protein
MKNLILSLIVLVSFAGPAAGHDMAEFYRIYSGMTGIPAQFTDEKLRNILKFTATMKGQEHPGVPFQEIARMILVIHNYEKIQKIENLGAFDAWSQEVLKFIKSGNEEQTLSLLSSGEPVKRWVALKKAKELDLLKNVEIAKRVETIFNSDPYIVAGRKWKRPEEQLDSAADNYIESFVAKLREEAADLLGKALDDEKVSADGLSQMKRYVETHSEEKLVMTSILLQMDPVNETMKAAQHSLKEGTFWIVTEKE